MVPAVFGLMVTGVLGYYFFFSQYFLISELNIEGASSEVTQGIEIYFDETSGNKRWIFLGQNSTILFDSDAFRAGLKSAFPRIGRADIEVHPPHALTIRLQERSIAGIWCASGIALNAIAPCFFYDEEGVIYEEAPNTARGTLIPFIKDMRLETAQPGDTVLSAEDSLFLARLYAALALAYEKPERLIVVNGSEVHAVFSAGWKAYFSRSESIVTQVESLVLVLEREIGSEEYLLEYIDLRLGNKVFYKFLEPEEL